MMKIADHHAGRTDFTDISMQDWDERPLGGNSSRTEKGAARLNSSYRSYRAQQRMPGKKWEKTDKAPARCFSPGDVDCSSISQGRTFR